VGDITVITLSFSCSLIAKNVQIFDFTQLVNTTMFLYPSLYAVGWSGGVQATLSFTDMAFDPVSKDPSDDKFLGLNKDRKER